MKTLNTKAKELIHLLNDGAIHDGNDLGQKLSISRTAVWKYIAQLRDLGIEIVAHKKRGYQCLTPFIPLDANSIVNSLSSPCLQALEIETHSNITSTQDVLRSKTTPYHHAPTLIVAEYQTQGRGRFQRRWLSPFGTNICLSLSLALPGDPSQYGSLSLIVGLSIVQALQEFASPLFVKWPNDIFYQGKKLSGCLIELMVESHGVSQALIGIGLNVNCNSSSLSVDSPCTSLHEITGAYHDRNQLIALLLDTFMGYLSLFIEEGLPAFRSLWKQHDALYDKNVCLISEQHNVRGKAKGINSHGHLVLEKENGERNSYATGEASLGERR